MEKRNPCMRETAHQKSILHRHYVVSLLVYVYADIIYVVPIL